MQNFTKSIEPSAVQLIPQHMRETNHPLYQFLLLRIRCQSIALRRRHRSRGASDPGEEDQQRPFQLVPRRSWADDRTHRHRVIGMELNEVQTPERRRMLILFPDSLSAKLDLHPAAFGREILP